MLAELEAVAPHIVSGCALIIALTASIHAILYKSDTRAAIAWVGFAWLVPILGGVLYVVLGINRIRRRARHLRGEHVVEPVGEPLRVPPQTPAAAVDAPQVEPLARLLDRVVRYPLLPGNRVALLIDGDEAYPAMLAAIDGAERSITLATYIFDNDPSGRRFADALARATRRGVEVRVLIDGVGARYAWPPMPGRLRRAGVPTARFLPTVVPWRAPYMNMRNHRKSMVIDGTIGFTGGMNIRHGAVRRENPKHPIHDLHARVEGPVVAQIQQTFVDDWRFTTGEALTGERWFPPLQPDGPVLARGIPDGPDEDLDVLLLTLLGALSVARERVRIMTPYFLPEGPLISALNVAALRGVEVDVVMPANNNLALVKWASMATLWPLARRGCHLWLSPGDFDHTKLMVVDGVWTLLGSGNWDPRSLRLNFELNVECYDRALAEQAEALIERRIRTATRVTLTALATRSWPVRVRDGAARLLSPYL